MHSLPVFEHANVKKNKFLMIFLAFYEGMVYICKTS